MADINLAGVMSFIYFLIFTIIAFLLLITSLLIGFIKKKNSAGSFYRYTRATGLSFMLGGIGILVIENINNLNFLEVMDRWGSFLVIILSSLISLFVAFKREKI